MSDNTIQSLQKIVGQKNVLTSEKQKAYYCKGFRIGHGKALAVALPQNLIQLWQVIDYCVKADKIILMQASNTGVTGGSTPDGEDYDREIIIISTRNLKGLHIIDDAKQIITFPGSTLTELEIALKPYHKEPHSVIGSSCIGASIVGGVCNNSGGSLIRRGPAFTEKSLFAQITESGELKLINHLGINLGDTPEEILTNLEQKKYTIKDQPDWEGKIWADDYEPTVRDVNASTPSRFNGNPVYLKDSAGSAGRVIVFAVRLATFDAAQGTKSFYIGTNDEKELIHLRRHLITSMTKLPIQGEYIHRNAFDLTQNYTKHVFIAIKKLGALRIPFLMATKDKFDQFFKSIPFVPNNMTDKVLQFLNRISPNPLPKSIMDYHQKYEHHLMIKVDENQYTETKALLESFFENATGTYFECNKEEEIDAFLLRFGVGICTINYCDYHGLPTEDYLVAFDVAFKRNDEKWRLDLPQHLLDQIREDSCCGHFFCFVIHQDYVIKEGVDKDEFHEQVIEYLNSREAKYPAEHNVGHLYHAAPDYVEHFHELDPTNSCNPGIGKTSKKKFWQ